MSSGGVYNCVHNGVTPRKDHNGWSTKANETRHIVTTFDSPLLLA